MTISTVQFLSVNVGTSPNDGTGDDLRTAFQKIDANFGWIGNTGFSSANIYVGGILATAGARVTGGYQISAPTSNVAVTVNNNVEQLILTPTGTVVSFGAIVTLPSANIDATTVRISSNIAVSGLQVLANPGCTVSPSANVTLTAGSAATYFFHASENKWFKIG